MSRSRNTFLWMAGLSVVTLLLGVAREFAIARELRASGAADIFFRGLVVIGAARVFGLSLFRARWIPAPEELPARALLSEERGVAALITGVALVALVPVLGLSAWAEPTPWVMAACVIAAVLGGAIRALAERAGHERLGFALEWGAPVGTIVGALALPGGALGPTLGLFAGFVLGGLLLTAPALRARAGEAPWRPRPRDGATRWLLLDTLVYVNLGLVDALISHVFAEGDFALLNYAHLFVNAVLMVPTAAATVVALRLARRPDAHALLRRWALVGGFGIGLAVAGVAIALLWSPVAAPINAATGWPIAGEIHLLILLSAPFAGLRFTNTVGRQQRVATDPKSLASWDLAGLGLRVVLLIPGALTFGVLASPVALTIAEIVQLGAWWRPSSSEWTEGSEPGAPM
ncbi:MAG: hypothetical protein R3A51_03200 [Nannocystaceae bacterium]